MLLSIIPVALLLASQPAFASTLEGDVDHESRDSTDLSAVASSGVELIPRGIHWSENHNNPDFDMSYPQTPYHELYPRHRVGEQVDSLGYTETTAEDLALLVELGCELFGSWKEAIFDGVKTRVRGAGKAAASYAMQKLFGYELSEEDQRKLAEIMQNPSWIPIAIDQMHQACASVKESASTSTTTAQL
jgi:hypothetical protein